ncbi:hypothetical protein B0O99DRAFT_311359 [Bisporella sp. PMI_857]|nr:hypothetical protein B0O99DRAFT_311359 [Bisporella sp. PMI_857]
MLSLWACLTILHVLNEVSHSPSTTRKESLVKQNSLLNSVSRSIVKPPSPVSLRQSTVVPILFAMCWVHPKHEHHSKAASRHLPTNRKTILTTVQDTIVDLNP